MANELVKFRRGLSKDLPTEKVPGTILVAEDTGVVYLDIDTQTRISFNDSSKLPLTGGTLTGSLVANSGVSSSKTPANTNDLTNKSYVDTQITNNKYTLPTASASVLGGIKVGTNLSVSNGVLSATDTTYSVATQSANGLLSKEDKTKLDGVATGANKYTHPTTAGNKHIPSGGSTGQILRWSSDGTAVWGSDNNTTYTVFSPASSSAAGGTGLVPQPAAGKQSSYLRGDGTWAVPTNTTYSAATTSANGLMTSAMVTKLNGIAENANNYSLPSATSSVLGGVKVGSNITVSSGTISLTKANVTAALGYTPPTSNTTYSAFGAATASAAGTAGLVPAPAAGAQAKFLRGDGTWQTISGYTHPSSGVTAGSYGPSANKTVKVGESFTVPYITVNAQGHVTSAVTRTITISDEIDDGVIS